MITRRKLKENQDISSEIVTEILLAVIDNVVREKKTMPNDIPYPTFDTVGVESWFTTFEGVLLENKVQEDNRKYVILLTTLPPDTRVSVQHLTSNPPEQQKYATLKALLIKRQSKSVEERAQELLQGAKRGAMKPSVFAEWMKNTAPPDTPEEIIKTAWLKELPARAKEIIAGCPGTLSQVADVADKVVYAVEETSLHVSAVNANPKSDLEAKVDKLEAKLNQVTTALESLTHSLDMDNRSRNHSEGQSRHRSTSRPRQQRKLNAQGICPAHAKFGDKAYSCLPGCKANR